MSFNGLGPQGALNISTEFLEAPRNLPSAGEKKVWEMHARTVQTSTMGEKGPLRGFRFL